FGQAYSNDIAAGKILDITELVEKHGKGILESYTEKYLSPAKVDGKLYGIPYYAAFGSQSSIYMRKDIIDKHQIDISSINTIEDLSPIFEIVKNNEPGMVPLASGLSTPLEQYRDYDRLGHKLGVLPNYDNDMKVENLYETDSYREKVELMHQWFRSGYINRDA